jgi:acyl transferase domain-containing protein
MLLRADPAHPGGMAAIAASEEKIACYISKLDIDSGVAIAIYNGPESHVIFGEIRAIEKLISMVKVNGLQAMKLVVDQGEFNAFIA